MRFDLAMFSRGLRKVNLWLFVFVLTLMFFNALRAHAQDANQFALAGPTWNNGGSPAVAGTALFAKAVGDSGTYAFVVADILPIARKPFTVDTNIGTGIAQRIFSIGKVPVLIPTSAGISINSSHTGWSWTTGAAFPITVKNKWLLVPTVRVVKSSVSNGQGYQPVVSVLLGHK